jgi:hypothetical protein
MNEIKSGAPCPKPGCKGVLSLVAYNAGSPPHKEYACPRCRKGWINGQPRKEGQP